MTGNNDKLTRYGEGALSSERLKKNAVTSACICLGQKSPLAPMSAVKPSTTPVGSMRPLSRLSWKKTVCDKDIEQHQCCVTMMIHVLDYFHHQTKINLNIMLFCKD